MGARQKLNQNAIHGCLIVGGLIGLAFQSWLVFFIVTVVLLGGSLHGGEIRPHPNGRTKPPGRGSRSNGPHPRSRPPNRE